MKHFQRIMLLILVSSLLFSCGKKKMFNLQPIEWEPPPVPEVDIPLEPIPAFVPFELTINNATIDQIVGVNRELVKRKNSGELSEEEFMKRRGVLIDRTFTILRELFTLLEKEKEARKREYDLAEDYYMLADLLLSNTIPTMQADLFEMQEFAALQVQLGNQYVAMLNKVDRNSVMKDIIAALIAVAAISFK